MNRGFACVFLCSALVGCATSPVADPYPGTGGLFLGTPSAADIRSGRAIYDPAKFADFSVGRTTKQQVARSLGQPAWWQSKPDGTSSMGYDYVRRESFMGMQKIERAVFTFNSQMFLEKADYPFK